MTNLSGSPPIGRWQNSAHPERRCTAHRKNGDQCKNPARRGTNVCDFHGAKAPQTRRKARRRLEEATDRMARELLGIATSAESESVRLQAIRDALDRGGVTAKTAVELSAAQQPAPWEELMAGIAFAGIAQITREESRARRGLADAEPPALPTPQIEVVDAQLVPEPGQQEPGPSHNVAGPAHPDAADLPGDEPAAATGHVAPAPRFGVLTFEEAVAQLPAVNRRSARPRRMR